MLPLIILNAVYEAATLRKAKPTTEKNDGLKSGRVVIPMKPAPIIMIVAPSVGITQNSQHEFFISLLMKNDPRHVASAKSTFSYCIKISSYSKLDMRWINSLLR